MSTRPHNGWWKASNNASRRWLDQLKETPSADGKFAAPVVPASAVPRLHVLEGRLQQS
ncbi:MAG TPA: hypothetical protein VGC69_01725 [Bordetella sp.]